MDVTDNLDILALSILQAGQLSKDSLSSNRIQLYTWCFPVDFLLPVEQGTFRYMRASRGDSLCQQQVGDLLGFLLCRISVKYSRGVR